MKPNKSPWWYEAKYEELQAKCNIYAGLALISSVIAVLALLLVGVIVYG